MAPWDKDRYMSPDILAVKDLLKEEKVLNAARAYMDQYHMKQDIETRVFSPSTFTMGEQRPQLNNGGGGRKRKTSLNTDPAAVRGGKTAKS